MTSYFNSFMVNVQRLKVLEDQKKQLSEKLNLRIEEYKDIKLQKLKRIASLRESIEEKKKDIQRRKERVRLVNENLQKVD